MVAGRVDVRVGATRSLTLLALALAVSGGGVACAGRSERDGAEHGVGGGAGETGTGGSSSGTGGSAGKGGAGGSAGSSGSSGSAGSGGSAGKVDCAALSAASEAALNEARRCDPNATVGQCTLRVTVGVTCGEDQFVNASASDAVSAMKLADAEYAMSCLPSGVTCGASRTALGANCSASGLCETVYDNGGRACRVDGYLFEHGMTNIAWKFDCPDCQCDDGVFTCSDPGCGMHCTTGTTRGTGCAICGPTDACLATDLACFPSCSSNADCVGTGSSLCLDGACVTGICG